MNILNRIKYSLNVRAGTISIRDSISAWLPVVLVFGLIIILASNLVRITQNAQANILVYELEMSGLKELQAKNTELQDQLSYYQSQEFKRIYARSALKLGNSSEQFYDIQEPLEIKKLRRADNPLLPVSDYTEFWLSLTR